MRQHVRSWAQKSVKRLPINHEDSSGESRFADPEMKSNYNWKFSLLPHSAEDWQCNKCANVNWARRHTCNMCNAPKFTDNEERTGEMRLRPVHGIHGQFLIYF